MSYGYDDSDSGYGGYTNYFSNLLYQDLYKSGDYESQHSQSGSTYYSGYAYENQYGGKSYHTVYSNSATGYYHSVTAYINGNENVAVSGAIDYNGSSTYYSHSTEGIDGNPFKGYSTYYVNYQASDGSSTASYQSSYETFGVTLPEYTSTYYKTIYTNAYGYSYDTSGSSHT